ncbi:hypothetical protein SteCoe_34850 [Stentor coeruleus]|uniref:Uncharacterized protein n=1 Tax=Stentor coeruleus TaxID=5963 RepID=A0A1R2ATM8_9CILI|nr:hypothetical protein SteCoe_34850 [Stentor coeruleus]
MSRHNRRGIILNPPSKDERILSNAMLPASLLPSPKSTVSHLRAFATSGKDIVTSFTSKLVSFIFPTGPSDKPQVNYSEKTSSERQNLNSDPSSLTEATLPHKRAFSPSDNMNLKRKKVSKSDIEIQTDLPYEPKKFLPLVKKHNFKSSELINKGDSGGEMDTKGTEDEDEEFPMRKVHRRTVRKNKNWISKGPALEIIPEKVKNQQIINLGRTCGVNITGNVEEINKNKIEDQQKTFNRNVLSPVSIGKSTGNMAGFVPTSPTALFLPSPSNATVSNKEFSFSNTKPLIKTPEFKSESNRSLFETPSFGIHDKKLENPLETVPDKQNLFTKPQPVPKSPILESFNCPKPSTDPIKQKISSEPSVNIVEKNPVTEILEKKSFVPVTRDDQSLSVINTQTIKENPSSIAPASVSSQSKEPVSSLFNLPSTSPISNASSNPFLNKSAIKTADLPYKFGILGPTQSTTDLPNIEKTPSISQNVDIEMDTSGAFSSQIIPAHNFTQNPVLFQTPPSVPNSPFTSFSGSGSQFANSSFNSMPQNMFSGPCTLPQSPPVLFGNTFNSTTPINYPNMTGIFGTGPSEVPETQVKTQSTGFSLGIVSSQTSKRPRK